MSSLLVSLDEIMSKLVESFGATIWIVSNVLKDCGAGLMRDLDQTVVNVSFCYKAPGGRSVEVFFQLCDQRIAIMRCND